MPCVVSVSQVGSRSHLRVSEMAVGAYVRATAPTFIGSAGQGADTQQTCCMTEDSILPSESLNFMFPLHNHHN